MLLVLLVIIAVIDNDVDDNDDDADKNMIIVMYGVSSFIIKSKLIVKPQQDLRVQAQ